MLSLNHYRYGIPYIHCILTQLQLSQGLPRCAKSNIDSDVPHDSESQGGTKVGYNPTNLKFQLGAWSVWYSFSQYNLWDIKKSPLPKRMSWWDTKIQHVASSINRLNHELHHLEHVTVHLRRRII